MLAQKGKSLDYEFPDITAKPGQFLPSIFSPTDKGDFDVEKMNQKVREDATDLQKKLLEERQKKIEQEKKQRQEELAKTAGSEETQKEMVRKGLASLGLEGQKQPDSQDEIEKRKKMMANLKEIIKE